MTTFRVARQKPDVRRTGRCPRCFALQGELCFALRDERSFKGRPRGGVHRQRLKANGIDPATVFKTPRKSRQQRDNSQR